MKPIKALATGLNVKPLQRELDENPELWNLRPERGNAYAHADMSDIWVRFNKAALDSNPDLVKTTGEHDSVWYPEAEHLPSARRLAFEVMTFVEGERLGGVLITRVPPGGMIKPHIDGGWHAGYYDKFAVQVRGDEKQAFCFEGYRLSMYDGGLYTFDNSKLHWVTNESDRERITLIICIKTNKKSVRVR